MGASESTSADSSFSLQKLPCEDWLGNWGLEVKKACKSGNLNSLKALLVHPGVMESSNDQFLFNQILRDGMHLACAMGHDAIISHIYESSSEVQQQMMKEQDDKLSLVHTACKNGHASTVLVLLGYGFCDYFDDKQECALYAASKNGLDSILEALVQAGGSAEGPLTGHPRNLEKSPLAVACHRGLLTTVQILISLGADVNEPVPLLNACAGGHVGICQALIAAGANVNGVIDKVRADAYFWRPGSTFLVACDHGKWDVAHLLLDSGADPNPPQSGGVKVSPLWSAFIAKQYSMVKRLLEAGADVNQVNMHYPKQTLLMDASSHAGRLPLMHQFLEFGATIDKIDEKGWTALMHACKTRNFEAAKYLIQHGADVAIVDPAGNTAVHLACRMGCMPLAIMLAENGANVYAHDNRQRTPLSFVSIPDRKILVDAFEQINCLLK